MSPQQVLGGAVMIGTAVAIKGYEWYTNKNEGSPSTGDLDKKFHTVDDLLKGAFPGKKTRGPSKQYEKPGGMDAVNEDFDKLNPSGVINIPGKHTRRAGGRIARWTWFGCEGE